VVDSVGLPRHSHSHTAASAHTCSMGAPEFGAIGFGYGIQFGPNAFHVFDRLGLMEPVLAVADSSSTVLMRDALDWKELVRMPTGPSLRARFKPGARSWFASMSFHGTRRLGPPLSVNLSSRLHSQMVSE
jgi:hypothetical protein